MAVRNIWCMTGQNWAFSDVSAEEIYGSLEEDATACLLYGPFIDLPKRKLYDHNFL